MDGEELRRLRKEAGLSQGAVADRLEVSQASISNWELGNGQPSPDQERELRALLEQEALGPANERDFGDWLFETRASRGLSRSQLAGASGVSTQAIYLLEKGRSTNPQEKTRMALETALDVATPQDVVEESERTSEIEDVGRMEDFDPHSDDEFPTVAGIYVLYDISDRPIYVGESSNIRRRLLEHRDRFWYKSPIVYKASYVSVPDPKLRNQLEETMIRFMKSNAVVNKQRVDR